MSPWLSGEGTRQGKGRKQEEGNVVAVAALQYLVSGLFLSPDVPVSEQASGVCAGRASVFDGVPSHVSQEVFDKDEVTCKAKPASNPCTRAPLLPLAAPICSAQALRGFAM